MTITTDLCQSWDDASPRFCFETKLYIRLLISIINDEGSTGPPTAWPNQAIVAFDRPYPGVQYIQKPAMTQVLDFLWGSIQYEDFALLGLIERDLWGPIRPEKKSGHGLSYYSFQGTIYAKSAMTQVLVILGGFSENRFFGTFQILKMSDLGGLTLVPYGLPGPNGDTKLLIWPLPLMYIKTAMTQVLDFVLRPNCTFACWFLL